MKTFQISLYALSAILLVGQSAFAADELPPPKLQTPEYLEMRKVLLESLDSEYHAPALRVWHRMIDFMSKSFTCESEKIQYKFGRNILRLDGNNGMQVEAEAKGNYLYLGGGGKIYLPGDAVLFRIADKHIVEVDLGLSSTSCGCCFGTDYPEFDKELLEDIAKFKKIQEIIIRNTKIDSTGLAELKRIERIDLFSLYNVELNKEAFLSLGQMNNTKTLSLGYFAVPGWHVNGFQFVPLFDISHLDQLTPLQNLHALRVRANLSTLRAFPRLESLEDLYLEVVEISDEALAQIKKLPNLKKVEINRVRYVPDNSGGTYPKKQIFYWEKPEN